MRVDALLPAVRALRAKDEPLRGPVDPDRLEFAASRSTFVVPSEISVSSPPMIAASATARSWSAITRSRSSRRRSTPSRVVTLSPSPARRTTMPPRIVSQSKAWSGLPSACMT